MNEQSDQKYDAIESIAESLERIADTLAEISGFLEAVKGETERGTEFIRTVDLGR